MPGGRHLQLHQGDVPDGFHNGARVQLSEAGGAVIFGDVEASAGGLHWQAAILLAVGPQLLRRCIVPRSPTADHKGVDPTSERGSSTIIGAQAVKCVLVHRDSEAGPVRHPRKAADYGDRLGKKILLER